MMHFEKIDFLYLGLIVPLLFVAYVFNKRMQAKKRAKLGSKLLVDKLVAGANGRRAAFRFVLAILALTALIVSLSNPIFVGNETTAANVSETQVVFAVDVSKSMFATDILPDRLGQAREFILQTIRSLSGEQVGMVLFAGKATPYFPFIADYTYVSSATRNMSGGIVPLQGTSFTDALRMSSSFFSSPGKRLKILCVISDGEDHSLAFERLSDSLRKAGVNLFAFGVGTSGGSFINQVNADGSSSVEKGKNGSPVVTRLNERNLLRLAGNDANNYFRLDGSENARKAFLQALRKLEDGALQNKHVSSGKFQLFLVIGLLFLILEIFTISIYGYQIR